MSPLPADISTELGPASHSKLGHALGGGGGCYWCLPPVWGRRPMALPVAWVMGSTGGRSRQKPTPPPKKKKPWGGGGSGVLQHVAPTVTPFPCWGGGGGCSCLPGSQTARGQTGRLPPLLLLQQRGFV